MKKMIYFLVCFFTILINRSIMCSGQVANKTITAKANTTFYQGQVADLAWMVGSWKGEGLGGECHEVWDSPKGGTMMGMFKLVIEGKVKFYEFITILKVNDRIEMRLKHFSPDFTGWEEKSKHVTFKMIKIEKQKAYFNGLTIEKTSPNQLQIHVLFTNDEGDKYEETFKFTKSL